MQFFQVGDVFYSKENWNSQRNSTSFPQSREGHLRMRSFSWHDRLVVLQWKHFLALLLYKWKDQSLVKWMYMIIFFFFTSCIFNNSRPFLMGSNKWRWRWQITPTTICMKSRTVPTLIKYDPSIPWKRYKVLKAWHWRW